MPNEEKSKLAVLNPKEGTKVKEVSEEQKKGKIEKKSDDVKKEAKDKIERAGWRLKTAIDKLNSSKKESERTKKFLKDEYNYESNSAYPPEPGSEDENIENNYLWDEKDAEKEYKDAVKEKHGLETEIVEELKSIDTLDPEMQKKVKHAVQREFIRRAIDTDKINKEAKNIAEKEARILDQNFDSRSSEKKKQILLKTKSITDWIDSFVADYEKIQSSGKSLSPKDIADLVKKNIGLSSFEEKQDLSKFTIPETKKILEDTTMVDTATRIISEKYFGDLITTLGDKIKWEDMPDSIKMRIQLDPDFRMDESGLPNFFREEIEEKRATWREEKRPDESQEAYVKRIQEATGVNEKQMNKIAARVNKGWLSPFVKFLADLLAPIGAMMGWEVWDFWRKYMESNPDATQWDMSDRFVRGAGGGWEVQGSMAGYLFDVNGEITESEKQSVTKIHEAFKKQVKDPIMQEKLLKVLERNAKNNPNFNANQPFLAHDVGTKQAFVYFPDGSVEVCPATHGYAGIGNKEGGGGTSLGSKLLAPWFEGWKLKYRTIVRWLESCNANDEQRLVRVHEWRWPGTKTAGCSGLLTEVAARLKEAVKSAGGGAEEVFNSQSVQSSKSELVDKTQPHFDAKTPEEFLKSIGSNTDKIPAGMKNNNPFNIKWTNSNFQKSILVDAVGPSQNRDQWDPQVVFKSPEAWMASWIRLLLHRHNSNWLKTVHDLIASLPYWWTQDGTSGNRLWTNAANEIAQRMGVGVHNLVNLNDKVVLSSFVKELLSQEQGNASKIYASLITSTINARS